MKAKIVKNKVAPPFRVAEFDMLSEGGISYAGDVLDMATESRVVEKSGSWFSYGDTRIGQGREKARQFLEENPEVLEEVKQKVLAVRGVHGGTTESPDTVDAEAAE
jgi:recombination protein RecA